jgi:hypothetical protein
MVDSGTSCKLLNSHGLLIFLRSGYEPVGRAFESLRAHHSKPFQFKQMRPFWLEHLVSVHLGCSRF